MAAILSIRIGLFGNKDVTPDQLKAFLTFVAGGIGTAATVLGTLLTKQHNDRERFRQQLQAVIDGMKFVEEEREKSAGLFSALVLLGHQHVAIRMLEPAWEGDGVDDATATWVVGQILAGQDESLEGRRASKDSIEEAATLLLKHAKSGDLTDNDDGLVCFPGHFLDTWSTDYRIPLKAKIKLLASTAWMLTKQNNDWWISSRWNEVPVRGKFEGWPIGLWVDCVESESDKTVRASAVALLDAFWGHFEGDSHADRQSRTDEEELPGDIRKALEAVRAAWPPVRQAAY
ncbi:hypothetical protein [Streptomyces sp. NPDC058954]|uniref:hypothetical protein n=1 Tax=Streptomyces sp. NPDC058954 TaxID=3346677 RepID=UPI0036AAC17E